ncbi:MAG: bifunctional phosphoglucose/phosphomannose isomerase [Actinomycetota bacterium]|nr:bifunctional phosphoglucose/phosphomannose isomerase [Actinomycetota bacterium]MDQ3575353.1 bifunctional phosphoglucose/phosphomannose isomerase [Actinomycetota bacterium]
MTPAALDSVGLWEATAGLPEQVEDAASQARGADGLPEHDAIENVVVVGMGGSGIAGDILLATAGAFMAVPAVVVKSYTLPGFVGDGSLVFAVSFSGDTEETIEAATQAAVQGATVVAVTSGGELGRLASSWGSRVVNLPDHIPQPRAAVGALAIPPLIMLEEVGLFPGAARWTEQAVEQLRRRRDQLIRTDNPASELARRIGSTIPLIHSSGALGGAAAQRWKTQVNENANAPAFWNVQPELCHNEVQGWGQHSDLTRQVLSLVALRHDAEHPQVQRRYELVAELVADKVVSMHEVYAEGDGELAQLLDLVIFGDFVSLHLADNEGIDPGPVPTLSGIKQEFAPTS